MHIGSSHPAFQEMLEQQSFSLEERYMIETFIEDPGKRSSFVYGTGEEGEVLNEEEEPPIMVESDEPPGENSAEYKTDEQERLQVTPSPEPERKKDPVFEGEVKEIVETALKKYPLRKTWGLYVEELNTGYTYGMNQELTVYDESDGNTDGYFRAASVVKLQVAYVAYRLIEKEVMDVEETYYDPVTKRSFYILPAIHTMVSRSDNNLLNTMLRLIGREKINETLKEYGILNSPVYGEINPATGWSKENNLKRHGTEKVGGKITPGDMGMILRTIYIEKEKNQYMDLFNKALIANIYATRIPRGIGNKYPVAHKTGTAAQFGVYNDAGIIYCENPFILVVLTKGETSTIAEGFIRELAKKLTDYMEDREQAKQ